MLKAILKASVFSAFILTATGCTTRLADLTVASTKNVNLNSGKLETGEIVEGDDTVIAIIIPFGNPDIEGAVDNATKSRCVVGLENAVIEHNWFYLYFGFFQYTVKGNELIDRSIPGCEDYVSIGTDNNIQKPSANQIPAIVNTR